MLLYIMIDFEIMSNSSVIYLGIFNLVLACFYIFVKTTKKHAPKPSGRNKTGIDTLKEITVLESLEYTLEIRKFEFPVKYLSREKELQLDYSIRNPLLENIVNVALYSLAMKSKWLRKENLIETALHSGAIALYISLIYTFFIDGSVVPARVSVYLLLYMLVLNFVDMGVRQEHAKKVFRILKRLDYIDHAEYVETRKIMSNWIYSNLRFYFEPLVDIKNFFWNKKTNQ